MMHGNFTVNCRSVLDASWFAHPNIWSIAYFLLLKPVMLLWCKINHIANH